LADAFGLNPMVERSGRCKVSRTAGVHRHTRVFRDWNCHFVDRFGCLLDTIERKGEFAGTPLDILRQSGFWAVDFLGHCVRGNLFSRLRQMKPKAQQAGAGQPLIRFQFHDHW
jgi:hypothetical protein